MYLDVDLILALQERINRINKIPFDKINLHYKGKKIKISKETADRWAFTGLNNMDFITSGYYKHNEEVR